MYQLLPQVLLSRKKSRLPLFLRVGLPGVQAVGSRHLEKVCTGQFLTVTGVDPHLHGDCVQGRSELANSSKHVSEDNREENLPAQAISVR